jgi:biopolymer transport protein ExbD
MGKFVIYLFETGICLVLLYLAYWIFLRKETYFNFNRLFLVGSIVLALSVPVLHHSLSVKENGSMERSVIRILQFRNSYQELVAMIDADFGEEPSSYSKGGREFSDYRNLSLVKYSSLDDRSAQVNREGRSWPIARILLFVYLVGVLYFLLRFCYLVFRLFRITRTNGVSRHNGFRMVEMREEISPFSFFRFLYINREGLTDMEMQNILAHEQAHISQQHTIDHLLAHCLAIFQWFNPIAWQIRNALKTTHEYIADRQVLSQGFKPFDYQTLLLKQVIGYHSVELVNNFNLKPIKKRITMMTKIKSGIPAKLKAMLVIPFALFVFLLFADFTHKVPGNKHLDLNSKLLWSKAEKSLTGLWEVSSEADGDAELIQITGDKFCYLAGPEDVREYFWKLDGDYLILFTNMGEKGTSLRVDVENGILTIWWSDNVSRTYGKTGLENTADLVLREVDLEIDLPVVSNFRILDRSLTRNLFIGYDKKGDVASWFQWESIEINKIGSAIESHQSGVNKLDQPKMTTVLWVDKDMPMGTVVEVKGKLREIGALKIADAGYPHDIAGYVSPLLYSSVGLPRVLPPMDAETLDKEDLEKDGVNIFTIDLSARNTTPAEIYRDLETFFEKYNKDKYVFSLEYDKDIPYGQYIETVDMIFSMVYSYRNKLALKMHNVPYTELGADLQKEIRKSYPMVLSEAWSGM